MGTKSAAWRRRQRRVQRNARQKLGNEGPVSPNRPLANNLTPPIEEQEIPDGELLVGDPYILVLNSDLANEAAEVLENAPRDQKFALLQWMAPVTLELALSVSGCRVVQAAVEVAGGEHRSNMTRAMHGHVAELLDSPHGNHVLQKCIEVLPPDTMQFVLDELCAFPDHGVAIAKHRFGCRILERLLEHCPAEQTRILVEDVIENAYMLCRHPFGNYVVQHVLEYGTLAQRNAVVEAILKGGVMQLAMHRVASNVIERALVQCTPEGRCALVEQLVADPSETLAMASSRYGSFIAQRLLELPASPQRDEVWHQLYSGIQTLKDSKHGKQLVASIAPEEAETESGPENSQETDDS
jgi:pumilio RNA-binding family